MGVNEPSTPKDTYEWADREMASERFRSLLYVRKLCIRLLLDYEVFCCSLCMRLPSAFAAEIEEDGTSLVSAPWGSGSF